MFLSVCFYSSCVYLVFMGCSTLCVTFASGDMDRLSRYLVECDVRTPGGVLLSRNQAVYSIVKSFLEGLDE